jgi:2-methylcitrate dehydratase PrpD
MNFEPRIHERADSDGPTRQIAKFVSALSIADIDDVARHAARRHLIDTVGACFAGANQPVSLAARRALSLSNATFGRPVAAPGFATRHDLLTSCYLMGASAHGLELDDGYRAGSVHPGAVVVPVVLSLGSFLGSAGADILRALVAGYEVTCRLSAASHPKARWRGFHNTGTAGVFGAASAASALLKFDADGVENALGIAASSAAGLFTFLAGGDVKRLHPGHAAREGLLSALLTREGLAGPKGALEFKEGYFNAYVGNSPPNGYGGLQILEAGGHSVGSSLAIAGCYMKPYACCRHIHPAIDAAIDLITEHDLKPAQISSVNVVTYSVAASHANVGWSEMTTAQMSYPFVLAVALTHRGVMLSAFSDEDRKDAGVVHLTGKIAVTSSQNFDKIYPEQSPATVTIHTLDGRTLEKTITEPLGSALNPLSDGAVQNKFNALLSDRISAERGKDVSDALWRIEQLPTIAPILDMLSVGG